MILGTKSRYAVMAMTDLAARQSEKPVALAEIASSQQIPLAYLEQIFMLLKRAGLVRSVRGPGGGYALVRQAGEIRIAEIVVAVDESLKMTRCEHDSPQGCMAGKKRCLTHDLWDGLGRQIYRYLQGISLADVCGGRLNKNAAPFQFDAPPAKTPETHFV